MSEATAGSWCELAEEASGEVATGTDRVRVVGYVTGDLSKALDEYCEDEQRSRSAVVALALKEYLAYRRRHFPKL